ncbi:variable surface protein [Plasmodium gonderi]|uniref:Variable surface protein n=1 Tax=Plasmodium gonderi TaxID=77519 RepID=A0A1Y1JP19_PLAGO|nr:variable surface protein [Plasmodium gonderi]GAW84219.1 variable surface protein [Plasmodium gonderi]
MSASNIEKFDFKGIFPNCMLDYTNVVTRNPRLHEFSLQNACSNIENVLNPSSNKETFKSSCRQLILYLDYIYSILSPSDRIRNCKYFIYSLKDVLQYHNCTQKNSRSGYELIINNIKGTTFESVSDVCKGDFEDIHDDIYSILKKLNNLYQKFLWSPNGCSPEGECYKEYMKLLCEYGKIENQSFRELLDKFKYENMKYMPDIQERLKLFESLKNLRIIILGLIIIPTTLLMIIFFFYNVKYKINFINYTPYGLLIQRAVKKMSNIWNKKNKDYLNIMDSSEFTHNNFDDNNYRIGGTTLGYQ